MSCHSSSYSKPTPSCYERTVFHSFQRSTHFYTLVQIRTYSCTQKIHSELESQL